MYSQQLEGYIQGHSVGVRVHSQKLGECSCPMLPLCCQGCFIIYTVVAFTPGQFKVSVWPLNEDVVYISIIHMVLHYDIYRHGKIRIMLMMLPLI